jgi:competence protein ComEA
MVRLRAVSDSRGRHAQPSAELPGLSEMIDPAGAADVAAGAEADVPADADGVTAPRTPVPAVAADGSGAEPDTARPVWVARLVRRGPWGALAERWVPEPLRGARVDPGRRGAVLLSVIATVAAVVAAVGVWWGRPQPRPVAPVALAPAESASGIATGLPSSEVARMSPAGSPTGAAPGRDGATGTTANAGPAVGGDGPPGTGTAGVASPSATGPIVVSVTGRVHHPGLVRLASGARVADAITAAGGPLDPADLTGLNLAARLRDGDSVVVAGPGGSSVNETSAQAPPVAPGGLPGSGPDTAPVDLNTADATALDGLPGVGPITAAAIIAWRTEHGPFTDIQQLQAIPGIGPAKYAQIAPHVTVSS